jgi:predicted Zn-ribbon and HTH transcriptional regulator
VFRKDLIDVLLDRPMSVAEIAKIVDETPRDVDDGLKHLLKSLKRTDFRATITPSHCRKCGFTFHEDKLRKPGKCPACHSTWLTTPLIGITRKR